MELREERAGEIDAVREVERRAFGGPVEAALVDRLRAECDGVLSLVAADGDEVVAHVMFSPVEVGEARGMALAPMAVLPERQRQGIGSDLLRHGLERLRSTGVPFVVVLGHPAYYPRFGFEPASRHGLECAWAGVPDDAFLVRVFDTERMRGATGVVRYHAAFEAVE